MAPRVYAMEQKGDLNGEGALISADVIDLRSNRLTNSGTIAGRKLTLLNTESLLNAGTITGDKVGINTTNNFDNIGGKVEAERALLVDVGGDLNHESTTMTTNVDLSHFQRSETTLARKALFHVKGEDGQLELSSNNLNAKGADIINDGNGNTLVQSKNNMNLTALSVGFDEKMGAGNHYRHEKVEEAVVSRIKGKGDVELTGKNILSEGAQLDSEAKLMAIAKNDLVLNGAKESRDFEEFHKTKSGSLARTTKTSLDQQHSVTQVGTQVSGKEVVLSAGHDVKAKGMQAIADNDLHIQAGHDVDIAADTNHFKNKRVETKKTRGVFTDGGIGFTVGSQSEKHDYETEGWTQSDARSTLGSMNGNIRVSAGNHTNVLGTDMITPNTNRIDIEGASIKVEAGKDIIERKEGHEYKQSGVTIALSTPVTDMAQAAYNSVNRSQQVTNGKLKALYAVKAAEEVGMAAQNVGKVAETLDALRAGNMQNTGTTSSPSVKVSIGYGSQKQTQSSESQSISHQKSTVSTGTFNVKARDEKLTFEGVDANAKLMALSGKKGIDIKGVKDEEHQHTKNKSVGGSVGVFVGTNGNSYGIGIEGSVNAAKGKSNSDSERWQNSHLQADKLITNSEAGNLSLDAANLNAKRWEADIQNLTITSRQDTEKYESKQTSASASGSVAQGAGGGASVSASYNKAKVDYAQVNEQAGIRVGEDGMDANIHNHTQLNGAIIESDAEASKNRFKTKSLTHTDIENKSEIKTESASMSAGSGGVNPMQALSSALSLLGNTNERARSITQSAISDNIQIETKTPENLTALSRDTKNANQRVEKQDLQKVQERQEMAKVIGDISNNAISIATYNEREKINKLSLEKFKAEEKYGKASTQAQEIGKQITAIQNDIDGTYGIGSKTGMAIRAVTAALQAAAQNDTAGSLVALASPYLNKTIHEMTAGDTAKDKAANLMAHALLSAVEFQVTGKDPLTGAVAGVTGEVTAQILTQAIYNKTPNQLTANEKENISTLSQLAGGLAAALTAKANGTTAEQGGSFLAATSGAGTAKRAVENNYVMAITRASALVCSRACIKAIEAGLGISLGVGLTTDEEKAAFLAGTSQDPEKISRLSKEQVDYLNRQILSKCLLFDNSSMLGSHVWIHNADGGFTPIDPSLVTTTYGGKQVIDPRIFVNHTGGVEYPADYNLPTHTGGNQTVTNDKDSHILVGGESQVGDWRDSVVTRDNRLPIPEPIKANNGLIIESNSKHTLGGTGNRPNAGIEPKDSLKLFESSVEGGKKRYAIDSEGRIHQFNSNKEGDRWHWAGRTGKDQRVEQRINPSDINKDVYERLGTHYNEVRKK